MPALPTRRVDSRSSREIAARCRRWLVRGVVLLVLTAAGFELVVRMACVWYAPLATLCRRRAQADDLARVVTMEQLRGLLTTPIEPCTNWHGFVLNHQGFRTADRGTPKPEGTLRVVAIGDSFTFSSGPVPYPRHFLTLLEEGLRGRAGDRRVEVVNLGQPAVGPRLERKVLEIEGLRSESDLVLWNFFVGNDFTDEVPLLEPSPPSLASLAEASCALRGIRGLLRLARLREADPGALAGERTQRAAPPGYSNQERMEREAGTYVGGETYDPERPTFTERGWLGVQAARAAMLSRSRFPEDALESVLATLRDVRLLLAERGIPLVIVVIPDENQVDAALLARVAAMAELPRGDVDADLPQKKLVPLLVADGFDVLDLLPVIRSESARRKLYQTRDTHWNAEGNAVAARAILKHLEQRGLPH